MRAVIGGHHGTYPESGHYRIAYDAQPVHGQDLWEQWRYDALVWLLREVQIIPAAGTLEDLPDWLTIPPAGTQVILEGVVIQSDWVASNGFVMPGLWDIDQVTSEIAQGRAENAVKALRFSPGWTLPALGNVFATRFPFPPRPLQTETEIAVTEMPEPGLVIVEAPMGEGKTEAALVAAEILARRFGAHGLFVGLPTQATTDAMFTHRVLPWLAEVAPGSALGLSHGKSVVNADYAGLQRWHSTEVGVDCGCDIYSPSQWFTGRKRLLLSPHVVGTIDNILIAGAQVKFVALHHLAFAQKVVILDEVHAADIYMSQFLESALQWLGASKVPVVLLSATLPESMRKRLIRAYTGQDLNVGTSYPQITVATSAGTTIYTPAATSEKTIRFEILDEPGLGSSDTTNADHIVADLLTHELRDGGCALVIRNTVARAQNLYSTMKATFPHDRVLLLHSRFTAGDRADHTEELLRMLGDTSKGAQRPHRLVVVATQVAEQSLDIDADILITDLAPIDLILQRAGRLHRHTANDQFRPRGLQTPTVVVTRMRDYTTAAADPDMGFPTSTARFIYPVALLARTAQLLYRTASITLPGDVPTVIAEVYEQNEHRSDHPDWDAALTRWDTDRSWADGILQIQARNATLNPPGDTIDGLNQREHDAERIMVRAGDLPLEISLLQRRSDGLLHGIGSDIAFELDGTAVGSLTDAEVGARVIASTVRISNKRLIGALCDYPPLPRWEQHPWLCNMGVLVLDASGTAVVATDSAPIFLTYSSEIGLRWEN
jgi:CRISPR-associated endonuclease/helicase Cas3